LPQQAVLPAPLGQDEVVGYRFVVVEEVLLDDFALVAEAEDAIVESPRLVPLHDVPENRLASDSDHRLRDPLGRFTHTDAEAAAEDDDLHNRSACELAQQRSRGLSGRRADNETSS